MKTLILVLAALMSAACSHSKANPPPPTQLSPDIVREARDTDLDSPEVFAALQKMISRSHGVLPEVNVLMGRDKTSSRSLNSSGRQWNALAKSKCRATKDERKPESGKDSGYETYTLKGTQCPVDASSTSQTQYDVEVSGDNTVNGSVSFQMHDDVRVTSADLRRASGVSTSTHAIEGSGVAIDYNAAARTGSIWSHGSGVMTNESSIGQIKLEIKLETFKTSAKSDLAMIGIAHYKGQTASFTMLRQDGQTTFRIGGRLSTGEEFAKIFDANLAQLKTL